MESSLPSIIKKTVYAVISAVLVNITFIFIVKLFIHPPETFSPFFYSLIALYTALGVVGAGVVYFITTKITKNYNKVFTWIAVVTLILSLIPDVQIYTNPGGADDIGATIPIVLVLMLTHIFAAFISIRKLTSKE
jgi:hypothetical protein